MIPAVFFSGHMIAVGLQENGPQALCINWSWGPTPDYTRAMSQLLNTSMVPGSSQHKFQKALGQLRV